VTATASGTGTVNVTIYDWNPGGTLVSSSGAYVDVYLASGNSFTSLTIVACNLNGGTLVYWWDGSAWLSASHQTYDAATQCVSILVNSSTSPSLSDLTGTPFGAICMIRPAEISKLAHRLGLGGMTIEKDYVLTWVLLAIAASPLRDLLALKGGTAIKKIYVPDYRFSDDLDFTLLDDQKTNADLQMAVEGLFPWLAREANITLAVRKVEEHAGANPTIYLNYIGPLQADITSRFLKVDFSREETLVFPTEQRPVRSSYSDCQARQAVLVVYSLEEILAENCARC